VRCLFVGVVVLVGAIVVASANASQIISTSSVDELRLGVNGKGEAMLTYVSRGKTVHVLAWGAVNANASSSDRRQLSFRLQYDGGYRKYYAQSPVVRAALLRLRELQAQLARATAAADNPERYALAPRIAAEFALLARIRIAVEGYWRTFRCGAYDGPALAWRVAACRAPDGSYWAVQEWPRKLPDYGGAPTATQAAMEVHLSHWTGAVAVITVHVNWAYRRSDHLYGTLNYHGRPVYGFSSTATGQPLDAYGRNVFVDTYDSAYGPGWRRENSFLSHNPNGSFCYGLYRHGDHPPGNGTQYRATVLGPGVTPDIMWQGAPPGPYDELVQASADRAILGLDDPQCKPV
jgi:hypothetical protein